jgi:hypothetical protein
MAFLFYFAGRRSRGSLGGKGRSSCYEITTEHPVAAVTAGLIGQRHDGHGFAAPPGDLAALQPDRSPLAVRAGDNVLDLGSHALESALRLQDPPAHEPR